MKIIADKSRAIGLLICFPHSRPSKGRPPPRRKIRCAPAGEKEYAWFAPYEKYDDALAEFSVAVLKMDKDVDMVVDIRTPLLDFLKHKQAADAKYHPRRRTAGSTSTRTATRSSPARSGPPGTCSRVTPVRSRQANTPAWLPGQR